eukprot:3575688-Rhodomonas_salina.1
MATHSAYFAAYCEAFGVFRCTLLTHSAYFRESSGCSGTSRLRKNSTPLFRSLPPFMAAFAAIYGGDAALYGDSAAIYGRCAAI